MVRLAQRIDTRVPALDNLTPRQAAGTWEGRERLEALLADFAWIGQSGAERYRAAPIGTACEARALTVSAEGICAGCGGPDRIACHRASDVFPIVSYPGLRLPEIGTTRSLDDW